MLKRHTWSALGIALSSAALVSIFMSARPVVARDDGKATPIGAWFGIARPCTPTSGAPSPLVDQEFCKAACGGVTCPPMSPFFPIQEMTMIPTLLADGTVVADDFAAVGINEGPYQHGDGHTTAHGKWAPLGHQRI